LAEETSRHPRSSTSNVPAPRSGKKRDQFSIATWNVQMMMRAGKLENVKREMARMKINILGLCETRWTREEDYYSDEFRVIQSGQRGLALILDTKYSKHYS